MLTGGCEKSTRAHEGWSACGLDAVQGPSAASGARLWRSYCALPAPCDGLEEWIEDRQRAVDSCFKNRSAWSDLDCRVWQHDYSFKSIEAWPLDACVVHSENASQNVLLGSLKAACSLADIHSWLAVRVNVVVTLCGREMTVRGAPQDWRQYFADFGARHLQGHLEDWTVKQPRNSADQLRQCALDCFTHWKHLCCQLWRLAKLHVCEKKDMASLVPLLWRHQPQRWRALRVAHCSLRLFCCERN